METDKYILEETLSTGEKVNVSYDSSESLIMKLSREKIPGVKDLSSKITQPFDKPVKSIYMASEIGDKIVVTEIFYTNDSLSENDENVEYNMSNEIVPKISYLSMEDIEQLLIQSDNNIIGNEQITSAIKFFFLEKKGFLLKGERTDESTRTESEPNDLDETKYNFYEYGNKYFSVGYKQKSRPTKYEKLGEVVEGFKLSMDKTVPVTVTEHSREDIEKILGKSIEKIKREKENQVESQVESQEVENQEAYSAEPTKITLASLKASVRSFFQRRKEDR